MREIKFRVWDKTKQEMYCKGFHINYDGKLECTFGLYPSHQIELTQFTGLHDKNGKEIWEGDIVKFLVRSKTYIKTVGWAERLARFWIIGEFDRLEDPIHWKIEVIGNIYSNPELLEDKK